MSSKARLKLAIFLVGMAVTIPAAVVGFILFTQFIAYFQQGADPASIFRGHELIIPEPEVAQWLPIEGVAGSIPKLSEQEEMIAAYWVAWDAVSRAQVTGDLTDLATYWGGLAYYHVVEAAESEESLFLAHGGHKLRLTFFSDDGSVASFEDENFWLEYMVDGAVIKLHASASIVMTLDQGFWRIRQIRIMYG